MACLQDIQRLFNTRNPFYAGFGNRITDALSYRSVDVPSSRIFTIDAKGDVKMELLELAGYKSSCVRAIGELGSCAPIHRDDRPGRSDVPADQPQVGAGVHRLQLLARAAAVGRLARPDATLAGAVSSIRQLDSQRRPASPEQHVDIATQLEDADDRC